MLHHEKSPEKPQYYMATTPPPVFLTLPFLAKIFRPPPIPSILKRSTPPLYEGGAGVGGFDYALLGIESSLSTGTFEISIGKWTE